MTTALHSLGRASALPLFRRRRERRSWRKRAERLPLDDLLSTLPSFPRPVLNRLVANLIDHLDEQDGDTDLEPEDAA